MKLEHQCIQFISDHLPEVRINVYAKNINWFCFLLKVLQQEEFVKFVLEDAASVVDWQETDTVAIIDDLRFYLAEFSTVSPSDMEETSEKMKLLDDFLENIGLQRTGAGFLAKSTLFGNQNRTPTNHM